ncbi:hypothetical protein RMR21_009515 [Agrobacterium sp. rho-8.1]|nr:hypothetical protein [Agrobacterium sp. rho-8.1]
MQMERQKTDTERNTELADLIIAKAWKKFFWYICAPVIIGLNINYFFFQ